MAEGELACESEAGPENEAEEQGGAEREPLPVLLPQEPETGALPHCEAEAVPQAVPLGEAQLDGAPEPLRGGEGEVEPLLLPLALIEGESEALTVGRTEGEPAPLWDAAVAVKVGDWVPEGEPGSTDALPHPRSEAVTEKVAGAREAVAESEAVPEKEAGTGEAVAAAEEVPSWRLEAVRVAVAAAPVREAGPAVAVSGLALGGRLPLPVALWDAEALTVGGAETEREAQAEALCDAKGELEKEGDAVELGEACAEPVS